MRKHQDRKETKNRDRLTKRDEGQDGRMKRYTEQLGWEVHGTATSREDPSGFRERSGFAFGFGRGAATAWRGLSLSQSKRDALVRLPLLQVLRQHVVFSRSCFVGFLRANPAKVPFRLVDVVGSFEDVPPVFGVDHLACEFLRFLRSGRDALVPKDTVILEPQWFEVISQPEVGIVGL